MRIFLTMMLSVWMLATASATDYNDYLTTKRKFTEVTTMAQFTADNKYCYILVAAEDQQLIVGVGRYEAKPDWASEETKALRYRLATEDPVKDLSNFFMVEKKGQQIGLRNMVYSTDMFQTHDNAGYMYVNTFTDRMLDEWSLLTPTRQDNYWLFESGKYPIASDNWACGYLGPWNKKVENGEPIALNRRNTTGDDAGHYRVFRIERTELLGLHLYENILTAENGFTEVKAVDDILPGKEYSYLLTAQDANGYYVGVGRYETKPKNAPEETKALRYRSAEYDPLRDLSNFFTIEKNEQNQIALRNVAYYQDLFQTHENAGRMYVNSYSNKTPDEWSLLTPTWKTSYWQLESVKYPISSTAIQRGCLGAWSKPIADDVALSLNNRTTSNIGRYRLFRIRRSQLNLLNEQHCKAASDIAPLNTTWTIINPSFEKGTNLGWTLNGKDAENTDFGVMKGTMTGIDGSYLMNAAQWWATNLSVSQTVENVPSGIYELSATMASYAGRTLTMTANTTTAKATAAGESTGVPVAVTVTVGSDQRLKVKAGSTTDWWSEGADSYASQCLFKIDNVRLSCKKAFLGSIALPLPNDDQTTLVPGQWYYYALDYPTDYLLFGLLDGMVYSLDADKPIEEVTTAPAEQKLTLEGKKAFFKTSRNGATLRLFAERLLQEGTFTVAALNVDGLPQKVATTTLNEDGPGSDGTRKISSYLAEKGYDIIGVSEDFNYHNPLMESLKNQYSSGTVRATLSVDNLPWSQLIQGKFRFDTDGLNLIWKNGNVSASNESWTQWNALEETDGNQYIRKGFRHYDVSINGGPVIDVYVLHMDAGDTNATWARESQWQQLADAINWSDHGRSKLIIGDTNSRWTREDIVNNFNNRLAADFALSDVWVERYQDGIYPTAGSPHITNQEDPTNYSNYEVVDKIMYINSRGANSLQLVPLSFRIEQDYTYGHIDGNDDTKPLGDHRPVVVTFGYTCAGEIDPLPTGIGMPRATEQKVSSHYYTIDGRRLNGRPSKPGLYIFGGRKIVVR